MRTESILNIGVTTTDPFQQPPKEWWDIEVSIIWAEESLKRSWSYFANGYNGYALVRQREAIASFVRGMI